MDQSELTVALVEAEKSSYTRMCVQCRRGTHSLKSRPPRPRPRTLRVYARAHTCTRAASNTRAQGLHVRSRGGMHSMRSRPPPSRTSVLHVTCARTRSHARRLERTRAQHLFTARVAQRAPSHRIAAAHICPAQPFCRSPNSSDTCLRWPRPRAQPQRPRLLSCLKHQRACARLMIHRCRSRPQAGTKRVLCCGRPPR